MVQLVKYLPQKHRDLSLIFRIHVKKQSNWEAIYLLLFSLIYVLIFIILFLLLTAHFEDFIYLFLLIYFNF